VVLWRISRHCDLSGAGGLRAAGRWHHAGQPVVYLAASPSAALLEVCVHTSANDVPPEFTLLKIEGPDINAVVIRPQDLPVDWVHLPEVTRDLGTAFLKGKQRVLQVLSAIVPETSNFVFNPMHADAARFRIRASFPYPFEVRLKR